MRSSGQNGLNLKTGPGDEDIDLLLPPKTELYVDGRRGSDTIDVVRPVDLEVAAFGGRGNDTLLADVTGSVGKFTGPPRALLDSYRQFATAAVRERLEAAERQSAFLAKGIVGLDLGGIEDGLAAAREGQEEDDWLTEAAEFLKALELAIVPLRDGLAPGWDDLPNLAPAIREESENRFATAVDLINTLTGKETDRAADLKKAETEQRELIDRVELSSRLAAISEHVAAAKWAQRAEELSGRFRSISTSLT
jgi:hypothetical protein